MTGPPLTKLALETDLASAAYDAIVLVSAPTHRSRSAPLAGALSAALQYDPTLVGAVAVLPLPALPAGRLVHAPTGPIDADYDDVRVFRKAALAGVQRALKVGAVRPLLVLEPHPTFENAELLTLLGALEALYVPIQYRELEPTKAEPVQHMGVFGYNSDHTKALISLATTLESGRRTACDIGDADPERMSPPNIEAYIKTLFAGTPIKLNVVTDANDFKTSYPLFEAVNRAAGGVERHHGRIVYMEYAPDALADVKETLFLVGKGVTYDTGGIDVKINGGMIGMSRDKCGAAAVIGFMQVVRLLQPKHVKVVAGVSLVRNSIGSNGYVADELIKARSGAKVRVVNTDAEGRMVMADVLCKLKEAALDAVNPHLFTIATLTGHAFLAVGEGYSIVLDNGPAHRAKNSTRLRAAGDQIGDIFEVSTIRRDDFKQHAGECFGDDIRQSQRKPSSQVPRGHQGPAAFLILASGLDKHGSDSAKPLKYSHLDIAASAGEFPAPATGSPVLALAQAYLL